MNRDGAMEIGQRVQELMEKLESDPTMTDEFLNGDGALMITRTGITYIGFEDRPDAHFEPSPMNDDSAAGLHLAEVKQVLVDMLNAVEADPEKQRLWMAGRISAIASVERVAVVGYGPSSDDHS